MVKKPIFVIQKHKAKKLHYDFRLEISGQLKSWVIPKGPSLNPKERRLAIEVAEHDITYADFEGTIPEGEYGAGTVMVWDTGTFENITKKDDKEISLEEAYKTGHIAFHLHGKKLKGEHALVLMKGVDQWLLIKKHDEYESEEDILEKQPNSAKTGKSLEEIEKT